MDETPNVTKTCENCCKVFPLQQMCFDLIVKTFERFYFAFTESKDADLQRNFKFLQRKFSVELTGALYNRETLKEEYFKLLLNENLNFLDGGWLESCGYMNSVEDIFCRLPNLIKLCFRGCIDEILLNVAKFCPKIVEIDVRFSSVTDNGVKYLCENNGTVPCPEIKILLIKGTRVTDAGAECLIRHLPLLERNDYPNIPVLLHSIYQENVSKFQEVQYYNLIELDILGFQQLPNLTDVLKSCLTICPNLKSLTCSLTHKEQLDLFTNNHLKKLDLYMRNINPKFNIDSFIKKNGCNLTHLRVGNCIISISILSEHCPVLKEFDVDDVNFTEEDDGIQVSFPCLLKCSFKGIRPSATKAFCALLSSAPKLESISFKLCRLSLMMKNQILIWCKSSAAHDVKFHHLKLEMKFLRDILLSCPSLEFMFLNNCSFDADNTETFLESLSERLHNKPYVYIINYSDLFGGMVDYSDLVDDSAFYLRMHSEEIYKSSNAYDALFREIAVRWNEYDSHEDVLN